MSLWADEEMELLRGEGSRSLKAQKPKSPETLSSEWAAQCGRVKNAREGVACLNLLIWEDSSGTGGEGKGRSLQSET